MRETLDKDRSTGSMWFVAKTRYFRQEIKLRDWFSDHGIESFVPTWHTDRRNDTEKPLVPNLVFVRTDKDTACSFITRSVLPMRYLIDCATHRMLVVPDKAMSDFQRVFDLTTDHGGLLDKPLNLGDRVRITRGSLNGVEGNVLEFRGRTYVVVGLLGVLWAKAQVPRAWLERI